MKQDILILDTNIWISYLISHKYPILVDKILTNHLDVVTCKNLVTEIREVLQRKKFRKYINQRAIDEAVNIHLKLCRYIEIKSGSTYFTDPKDNFLLDLYKTANATILVTGDKQLIEQAPQFEITILTLNQFESTFFMEK